MCSTPSGVITEEDTPEQRVGRDGARIAPSSESTSSFVKEDVEKVVAFSGNRKAPGPDLIKVCALRATVAAIPGQLVRLFNGCLQWGVFPLAWKDNFLKVLLKGEGKNVKDPKSCRPICLLSVVEKLYEKLLKWRIDQTAMAPGRVSDRQIGFMTGKSTELAIVELRLIVDASEHRYDASHAPSHAKT